MPVSDPERSQEMLVLHTEADDAPIPANSGEPRWVV
jgi:hypothetical protein